MIKKIISGILAVLVLLSAVTVSAQTSSTTPQIVQDYIAQLNILRQLRQGMSGDDIKILQSVLAMQPDLYPEGLVTGYYGPLTSKAVAKFQKKYGIWAVGEVGPLTRAKLNEFFKDNLVTEEDDDDNKGKKKTCASIPPGHLIAPGQLKKRNGQALVIPPCQKLPPGIAKKLGLGTTTPGGNGTTTIAIPVISSVMATSTASTSATISWATDQFATSWVWYGTSTPVVASTSAKVGNNSFTKNHSVALSGLTGSTTYHYFVTSSSIFGKTATSSEGSFMTK